MTRPPARVVPRIAVPLQPTSSPRRPRFRLALTRRLSRWTIGLVSVSVVSLATTSLAAQPGAQQKGAKPAPKSVRRAASPDHHVGYASYYARKFFGRRMADGTPMRPESDNAASLTLPLGSKAMVTNLINGRTALVTIRDRGPFVKGRIIDVSPSTAKLLGILQAGVAKVAVIPVDALAAEQMLEDKLEQKLDEIIAAADPPLPTVDDDMP